MVKAKQDKSHFRNCTQAGINHIYIYIYIYIYNIYTIQESNYISINTHNYLLILLYCRQSAVNCWILPHNTYRCYDPVSTKRKAVSKVDVIKFWKLKQKR